MAVPTKAQREFEKQVGQIMRIALAKLPPKEQDAALDRMKKALGK